MRPIVLPISEPKQTTKDLVPSRMLGTPKRHSNENFSRYNEVEPLHLIDIPVLMLPMLPALQAQFGRRKARDEIRSGFVIDVAS